MLLQQIWCGSGEDRSFEKAVSAADSPREGGKRCTHGYPQLQEVVKAPHWLLVSLATENLDLKNSIRIMPLANSDELGSLAAR